MENPSFIVELVGPAGAGKTTLTQALGQHNNNILIGDRPRVRRISHFPFFARNALLLLPEFLQMYAKNNSKHPSSREIALMLRLKGWQELWRQQVVNNQSIIILDQGPVFSLAELSSVDQGYLTSPNAKQWWESMYQKWAAILDAVIWLDAADSILMDRINSRNKAHFVKGKPKPEITNFLARYRMVYNQVIFKLTACSDGPVLYRFDSAQEPLDEITRNILVLFGLDDREDRVIR